MRPEDAPPPRPTRLPRRRPSFGRFRFLILGVVVVGFLGLVSVRGLAGFYTDYLWFDSLGHSSVFRAVFGAQVVLVLLFMALFFTIFFGNLVVAQRLAPPIRPPGPEEDLLVHYHTFVGKRARLVRIVISALFALIAGLGVSDKWRSAETVEVAASLSAWLLGLPAFVLLVIWSWRASKNIQTWEKQSGRDVRRGAGWAIGGWFIPIGNFWIPYQTIQDAWQRAPWTDGSWQRYDDPQRNNAWLISWLTWVSTNLLSRLVTRNWLSDETPREFRTNYFLDAFTNVLLAVSVISLIIAVKQISDRHALRQPSFP